MLCTATLVTDTDTVIAQKPPHIGMGVRISQLEERILELALSSGYYWLVASPLFPCSFHARFRYRQRNNPSIPTPFAFAKPRSICKSATLVGGGQSLTSSVFLMVQEH